MTPTDQAPFQGLQRPPFDWTKRKTAKAQTMLPTLSRWSAPPSSEPPSFDFERNPYKAKRIWPPDFDKLSEKHQFRLERRYKRRAQLKWARPNWMIGTKLAQYGLTIGRGGLFTHAEIRTETLTRCSDIRSIVHGLG